jgi:hypothetical protein
MEVRAAQSGEIHVIVGPMFAGKTTALLRRVQAEAGNGRYGKKTQATLCLSLAITCFADRAGPPARDLSSMDFFLAKTPRFGYEENRSFWCNI